MKRLLYWLDQRFAQDNQWLTAWTLMSFVATLVFMILLIGVSTPLVKKTELKLVSLELAGACPAINYACPVVKGERWREDVARKILAAWDDKEVLDDAKRAQRLDFFFPFAYGALFSLAALGMWRIHPAYPQGGLSRRFIALGAVAAGCDQIENLFLYAMLLWGVDPGGFSAVGAALFALVKFGLLLVAALVFLHARLRQYFLVGVVLVAVVAALNVLTK
jgi:hypothetical protein